MAQEKSKKIDDDDEENSILESGTINLEMEMDDEEEHAALVAQKASTASPTRGGKRPGAAAVAWNRPISVHIVRVIAMVLAVVISFQLFKAMISQKQDNSLYELSLDDLAFSNGSPDELSQQEQDRKHKGNDELLSQKDRGSTYHPHKSKKNNTNATNVLTATEIVINATWDADPNRPVTVPYQCPTTITRAKNDKDGIFNVYNKDTERHASVDNSTLDELLHMKYGAWGITPLERKELNARWVHWYAEALQKAKGKTIYESACGVGLTLYVILELLQEQYNITGLEVYGNEYILENVETANQFYSPQPSESEFTFPIRRGRICAGDSTNLSFVPSDSFDLVMTGYIDPINDPLNLGLTKLQHNEYCRSKRGYRKRLMHAEQRLVENWFAAWTGEMIRIAKPGSTIIVESISKPFCEDGGWGGVDKPWWTGAVHTYGWDVDKKSIETKDFDHKNLHKGVSNRYNVKMVKRNKKE